MARMNKIVEFLIHHKPIAYASKILIASLLCWYGLLFLGIPNPIWAVITVMVVSDPSLTTTWGLARVRLINTIVGCIFGLSSILLFGYSPLVMILTAAFTVMFVNLLSRYPVNWRLAPVTVLILMDAGRLAETHAEEFHYVMLRLTEIAVGSLVALALAGLYTKLAKKDKPFETPPVSSKEPPLKADQFL